MHMTISIDSGYYFKLQIQCDINNCSSHCIVLSVDNNSIAIVCTKRNVLSLLKYFERISSEIQIQIGD